MRSKASDSFLLAVVASCLLFLLASDAVAFQVSHGRYPVQCSTSSTGRISSTATIRTRGLCSTQRNNVSNDPEDNSSLSSILPHDNESGRKQRPKFLLSIRQFVDRCLALVLQNHKLPSRWRRLKSLVRTIVERYTIYVLECSDGKYYVGSTRNKKRRFQEHFHNPGRGGAVWTKLYRPIRVLQQYKRVPAQYALGLESKVTAEIMLEYGVNNVRGAMFCSPRNYTTRKIDTLTNFLGHYNELSYVSVRQYLQSELPVPTYNSTSSRKNSPLRRSIRRVSRADDTCFQCGQKGHWAVDCPSSTKEQRLQINRNKGWRKISNHNLTSSSNSSNNQSTAEPPEPSPELMEAASNKRQYNSGKKNKRKMQDPFNGWDISEEEEDGNKQDISIEEEDDNEQDPYNGWDISEEEEDDVSEEEEDGTVVNGIRLQGSREPPNGS
ncbi:CULLIN [Seminavis robusta]|uniref:CULLIN n=1 Tax=Seminavis robusta TaxID=568900 RepID=A0A9N8HAC6_9STRA|nr:CULLIN [Seminavis robusta]|eukprot:Sro143_g066670.1 CULLIN (438) ;mRNA; f:64449-65762